MARQGGTVVMVSAVSDRKEMDESGFLPLSVDYREKVSTLCFLCSMLMRQRMPEWLASRVPSRFHP